MKSLLQFFYDYVLAELPCPKAGAPEGPTATAVTLLTQARKGRLARSQPLNKPELLR